MPTISEALATAVAHHRAGRLQAAEQIYRQILAAEPNQPDAWNLLGVVAQQAGKLDLAVEYIGRAIRLLGTEAGFHNNLGNAFRGLRKPDEAAACYRQALALDRNFAEAHNNLGTTLQAQGNLDEAVACYRRALKLNAGHAEIHNNLGGALKDLGRLDEAVQCCRRAVRLKANYAEAHNNLGNALAFQGKLDEAAACYHRALALKPNYAEAHNNLSAVLQSQGKLDEAIACCRRALQLKPDYAGAYNNLGVALQEQGKLDQAAACWRRTLEFKPDHAGACKNLGDVLQYEGKLEEAAACYRRVVQLEMGDAFGDREKQADAAGHAVRSRSRHAETRSSVGEALLELATILRGRLPEDDLRAMRHLASAPNLRDDDRAALHYGLAQALDARGDYDGAAEHLVRANAARLAALKKSGRDYSPAMHRVFIDGVVETFAPQFFARIAGFGLETELPVFIVGLPRSGTTLVEQVLASHSGVFGGGELPYCNDAFQSLPAAVRRGDAPFRCLLDLDREAARRLARRYEEQLRALDQRAARIVDKMPGNHQYLGFIRALFPRARLIHCRRDLRDVALSCWATKFASLSWTCDRDHIVSYFQEYARVMDDWRRVLPSPPLDVDYRELVEDTEAAARRVVEWCGLEWEARCLDFHRTQRTVRTASATQVRMPIYTSSLGRWKNYEKPLGELFARVQRLDAAQPAPVAAD